MRTTPTTTTESPGARRILDVARPLFAARGYDGVSIQKIADAAGVSKANVFHHFANKAALYAAVLHQSAAEFRSLLSVLDDVGEDGVGTFARAHMAHLHDNIANVGMFMHLLGEPQATPRRELAETIAAEALDALVDAFTTRQRAGVVPSGLDCGALAVALLGGNLLHLQLRRVLPRTRISADLHDPERFASTLARLLVPPAASQSPASG